MLLVIVESIFRKFVHAKEKSVKNEIVLITGAGRGIGRELAIQYASFGATVVCWGVTKDKNQATVDEISRLGYPKAYFYQCDVANQSMVEETAEKVLKEVGDVTILINNAGIAYIKPMLNQSYTEIENTLKVNILSHFWTLKAFLPTMIKNNHGHIVANCSVGGLMGLKNGLPYCASKFAVRGMMEALYLELQSHPKCQIKVTTVYPYLVKTDIFKKASVRFAWLLPILDAQYVAGEIISAQRRDIHDITIPGFIASLNAYFRLFPFHVAMMVYTFFDVSIHE